MGGHLQFGVHIGAQISFGKHNKLKTKENTVGSVYDDSKT